MRLLAFALACSAAVALQTTHVCSADGAWGDTCHYTNVCFSGSPGDLIIFSDHHSDYHVPKGNTGIFAATKMPKRVGGPPNPKRVTPLHYKFQNAPTFISPGAALSCLPWLVSHLSICTAVCSICTGVWQAGLGRGVDRQAGVDPVLLRRPGQHLVSLQRPPSFVALL